MLIKFDWDKDRENKVEHNGRDTQGIRKYIVRIILDWVNLCSSEEEDWHISEKNNIANMMPTISQQHWVNQLLYFRILVSLCFHFLRMLDQELHYFKNCQYHKSDQSHSQSLPWVSEEVVVITISVEWQIWDHSCGRRSKKVGEWNKKRFS